MKSCISSMNWILAMTLPLIDADILLYEVGFSGEYKDEMEQPRVRDFDFVADLFDQKIVEICEAVFNSRPPILYFTNTPKFNSIRNKLL